MNRRILLILILMMAGTLTLAQQPSPTPTPQSQGAGKRPPQAKTQQEYKDYNAAYAVSGGVAAEKAAKPQ